MDKPTAAPAPDADGPKVRRFDCFTREDGVYESATGDHVEYAAYESALATIAAQAREIAALRKCYATDVRAVRRRQTVDMLALTNDLAAARADADKLRAALENCRLLAARRARNANAEQEYWRAILRFCEAAGVKADPLRAARSAARGDGNG